ncbi:hypothetical protein D9613_010011 [Agrocybe pediades]|uniref:Uncharacterized protein n=1 Tax=Agrocybe pediades TaxID=84607 RepID=A0A8H4QVZ2_9AGAR|nr:hypothetical protein D9613_010011 [Agrocybe pediades]
MAAPPVTFHQPKHAHPGADGHSGHGSAVARLPVIPDLRFEYSYLRSIQPYVHVKRHGKRKSQPTQVELMDRGLMEEGFETLDATLGMPGKEKEEGFAEGEVTVVKSTAPGPSETITLQWRKIFWVTMRDQVISPLLQGALWALASYYVRPFSAELGSRMGTFVHKKLPAKEGSAVSWLRNWAKSIGLAGSNNTGRS